MSDVNIHELYMHHKNNKAKVTLTAIRPAGRFGALSIEDTQIHEFVEKPLGDGNWINGGFMVCEPEILELLESDATVFEQEPLQSLAKKGMLHAYKHHGFWHCMDTLRDKISLNKLWHTGQAYWKRWE